MNSELSNEERQNNPFENIIQIVDDPSSGWKPLSLLKKVQVHYMGFMSLIAVASYVFIVYYAVTKLFPFVGQEPSALLVVTLGIFAFLLQAVQAVVELTKPPNREGLMRITTKWNYDRIKEKVEKQHWLLLKTLIHMKTLQPDFRLSEVRRKCPCLFNEENLIRKVYDLSQ